MPSQTPEERRQALEQRYPAWPRHTFASHFAVQCRTYPDRPLLLTPTQALTYAEVWDKSRQIAKSLLKLGVKRRDHVALLMANEPEYVMTKLAIALVGAVCVPLNTMLKTDELRYVLKQSDCRVLVLHQTAMGIQHAKTVSSLLDPLKKEEALLEHVICIPNTSEDLDSRFLHWEEFLAQGTAAGLDEALEARTQASEYPDEVCDIVYTSGSTGTPKGVMLTHDMVLRCAYATAISRAFEDGRRFFTPLPLYHVFAYIEGLMAASFVGGCVITMPSFSPKSALDLMQQYRAQDFLCVPSMLVSILNHPDLPQYDLSSLYALMCAAAPAPVAVWEQAMRELGLTEVCTGYGGTEVTASTAHTEVGDSIERITTRVGRLKPGGVSGLPEFGGSNIQYKVIDPFTGEDLPPGSIGELTVRGNTVTRGYYKKPAETAAAIDKDGWFRSGDLGRIDEHGYIEFLGRSTEMYKVSGENVSPKEVEDVINRHPAVAQAYVVGVPDNLTTETGAAFIQLKAGMTLTRRDVVQWCSERLAKFKIPRHVWFMEQSDWPMTGTGKIQKFKLRELAKQKLEQGSTAQ
ncbi:acyl--CoA ligase [Alicyclobacillus cycloheptanicus]|uniref:Fatty-acyl-CoA synthase n=1 Tax=Alicyclobacillus cycloheptanicus TaxID=1457 RepID=A0ABT9XFA0_9BACL|nr:class I adenylate-forming enzyme family protein [Alicyclobacillus cycloheptanicus]MDQ0188968.1 fatty-acyl-CoA synthase [Alicyclobacillus cycloheptanicus]WDM01685.1 acyl--CoA ligase [Alicyclobacillus cycloheptanicus]